MIVACHFAVDGRFRFSKDAITINRLWTQFISMGGYLGDNIFVLISGYFLVSSSGLTLRKILNIWSRVFFYSVVFWVLFYNFRNTPIGIKKTIKSFMPLLFNQNWFATCWLMMYLIHPYINTLLKNLSRDEYIKMLLITGLCVSVIPIFTKTDYCGNLGRFIFLYCIAGFFRLHAPDFGSKKFIWLGIAGIILNFLVVIVFDYLGLMFPKFADNATYFYKINSPTTVLIATSFLIGFRSSNINYSRVINTIASAAFGVYLIHGNIFMDPFLWCDVFKNASFQDSNYLIIYSIGVVIFVYVVCTVIELLRSKVFKIITRGYVS